MLNIAGANRNTIFRVILSFRILFITELILHNTICKLNVFEDIVLIAS